MERRVSIMQQVALRSAAAQPPRSMWPALALGLAAFLTNFDVTAVVVALPAIARELNLGISGYAWIMDAYSLALTASLLVAGALADRYGRRIAMLCGNAAFAAASVACGLAWDGPALGVARALQGIGAAFVLTGGIALIAAAYPQAALRTRAFSWLGVISGVAMAIGPTLGGVVASWLGWRWIFFANIPACALVAWGVPRLVAEARESSPRPLDYAGTAMLTAALFALIEALLHAGAAPLERGAGIAAAVLLLALFAVQQRRRARPIFDPAVFMRPEMVAVAALLAAVSIGYWAVLVYLPLLLAAAFGWSSDIAGLAMLAATLPMLVVPPLGARIVVAFGWRRHFSAALAVMAAGDVALIAASSTSGAAVTGLAVLGMVAAGFGAALAHPQLSGAVVALVPADQAGMASALTVVMRQGGFAIGIAVLGALLGAADRADAYALPIAAAAAACVLGSVVAMVLLPAKGGAAR